MRNQVTQLLLLAVLSYPEWHSVGSKWSKLVGFTANDVQCGEVLVKNDDIDKYDTSYYLEALEVQCEERFARSRENSRPTNR